MTGDDIYVPDYVQKDIDALQAGLADPNCSYVDCLVEELAATINTAASSGDISDEVADWLFWKYLRRG